MHLQSLTKLTRLALGGTQITDDDLVGLIGHLPALEELYVPSTFITEAGVEQINKLLPNCEIYR